MTAQVQNVSVSINKSQNFVYEYASNPENLSEWAIGLSKTKLVKHGDAWLADSPMGKIKVNFVGKNIFDVLDHDVTLPDGTVAHNPFRILKNQEAQRRSLLFFAGQKCQIKSLIKMLKQ